MLTHKAKLEERAILVSNKGFLNQFVIHPELTSVRIDKNRPLEHALELDTPNFAQSHYIEDLNTIVLENSQILCIELLQTMGRFSVETERFRDIFWVVGAENSQNPHSLLFTLEIKTGYKGASGGFLLGRSGFENVVFVYKLCELIT